ncbi:MAG: hypothetical protein V4632_08810 [Pseudomonadota bacterium]
METELAFLTFKQYVDATPIEPARELRSSTEIYEVIKGCFPNANMRLRELTNILRDELVVRHIANDEPLNPYFNIAYVLDDSLREGGSATTQECDWLRAIHIIQANRSRLSLLALEDEHNLKLKAGAVARGKTVKNLRKLGYDPIILHGGKVSLSDSALEKLAADIDRQAKEIGGQVLVNNVFENVKQRYEHTSGRYQLVRQVSTANTAPDPQIPWGYLYQLGIKHFQIKAQDISYSAWARLLELVTTAAAALDVQPYSGFASFYLKPDSVMAFLRDSVIYDSLFTLPQVPFRHAEVLYCSLIEDSHFNKLKYGEIPIKAALETGAAFLRACHVDRGMIFTAAELAKDIKKSKLNVGVILDTVFAHAKTGVNSALGFPPKSTQVDAGFRPLLKFDSEKYWCPPQPIAGPAVIEALLTMVRKVDKNADSELGILLETLLRTQLALKGVEFKSGKYICGGDTGKLQEGECDIVVETESSVIFFEVKKKPLTRMARSGDEVEILVDLSQSLIDSQLQALRHEHLLRKYGMLKLVDTNGKESVLTLGIREVIRVSVAFLDFGSIQDRSTIRQFMQICCGVDFTAVDPSSQHKLDKLRPKFAELKQLGLELGEFQKNFPLDGSYLLSVPQLLLLLDHSSGTEAFATELLRNRHIMTPTKDFYSEYIYLLNVLHAHSA